MPSLESAEDVRRRIPTIRRRNARYKSAVKHLSIDKPHVIPKIKRSKASGSHRRSVGGKRPLETGAEATSVKRRRKAESDYEPVESSKVLKTSSELEAGKVVCAWPGCGRKASSSVKLMKHLRKHTESLTSRCLAQGCTERFSRFAALFEHLRTHYADTEYKCMRLGCAKKFATETKLTLHFYKHINEYGIACPWEGCAIRNWGYDTTLRHMATHCGHFPFNCEYEGCTEGFSTKKKAWKHRISHVLNVTESSTHSSGMRPSESAEKECELNNSTIKKHSDLSVIDMEFSDLENFHGNGPRKMSAGDTIQSATPPTGGLQCRIEFKSRLPSEHHDDNTKENSDENSEERTLAPVTVQKAEVKEEEETNHCSKSQEEQADGNTNLEEMSTQHSTSRLEQPRTKHFDESRCDGENCGVGKGSGIEVPCDTRELSDNSPYFCPWFSCGRLFATKKERTKHMKGHTLLDCSDVTKVSEICTEPGVDGGLVTVANDIRIPAAIPVTEACANIDRASLKEEASIEAKVVETAEEVLCDLSADLSDKPSHKHRNERREQSNAEHNGGSPNGHSDSHTEQLGHMTPSGIKQEVELDHESCGADKAIDTAIVQQVRNPTKQRSFACPWDWCEERFAERMRLNEHIAEHIAFDDSDADEDRNSDNCEKIDTDAIERSGADADENVVNSLDTSLIGNKVDMAVEAMLEDAIPTRSTSVTPADPKPMNPIEIIKSNDENFSCRWGGCRHGCDSSSKLREHVRIHYRTKKSRVCRWENCKQRFDQQDEFAAHVYCHTFTSSTAGNDGETALFPCIWDGCGVVTNTHKAMNKHLREHVRINCPYRGCRWVSITSPIDLNTHATEHYQGTQFHCAWDECAYVGTNLQRVLKHMREHKRNLYSCTLPNCTYGSKYKERVDDHSADHFKQLGRRLFLCPAQDCQESFTAVARLRRHRLELHQDSVINCVVQDSAGESLVCAWPDCRSVKTSRDAFTNHLKKHIQYLPMTCPFEECRLKFQTNNLIAMHMKVHKKGDTYVCAWHDEKGANDSQPICKFECLREDRFFQHMRTHTQKKQFACTWLGCVDAFSYEEDIVTHMMLKHSGVSPPFMCTVEGCAERFATESGRKWHQKNSHGASSSNTMRCTWLGCRETYSSTSELEEHLKIHTKTLVAEQSLPNSIAIELDAPTDTEASGIERIESPGVQSTLAKANDLRPSELGESTKSLPPQTHQVKCIAKPDAMPCTRTAHVEAVPESTQKAIAPSIISHIVGERVLACHGTDCSKIVEIEEDLREHVMNAHVQEVCPYPNCDWVSAPHTTFAAHAAEHLRNQVFVCALSDCGYTSNSIANVIGHMRKQQHGRQRFACLWTKCTKKDRNKKHMRTHMRVDHKAFEGVPMYLCVVSECHEIFSKKQELQQHKAKCHQDHAIADVDMELAEESLPCAWPDCNVSVMDGEALRQHMKVHVQYLPQQCPYEECDMISPTEENLAMHVKGHNTGEVYACPWSGENWQSICDYRCSSALELLRHMRTHTKAKPYSCTWEECHQSYNLPQDLIRHMLSSHSGVTPFVCNVKECTKQYATKHSLARHFRNHHTPGEGEIVQSTVEGCNKTFSSMPERALHFRGHTGVETATIPHENSIAIGIETQTQIEGDEISPTQALSQQRNSMGDNGDFGMMEVLKVDSNTIGVDAQLSGVSDNSVDDKVGYVITKFRSEGGHAADMHAQVRMAEPLQCAWKNCDVVVAGGDELSSHVTAHIILHPVTCPYQGCSLSFETEGLLRPHFVGHFETNPTHCIWDGCDYNNEHPKNFLRHLLIHTKARIYACSWPDCTLGFSDKAQAVKHMMRRHSGVLPYICTISRCSKRYSTQGALNRHMRVKHAERTTTIAHEGNVTCAWEGCGAAVADGDALLKHFATHVRALPVICPFQDCGLVCLSNGMLVLHCASHFQKGIYICDWKDCNHKSGQISKLIKHRRTHTREPEFACTWTGSEITHLYYQEIINHMMKMHSYVLPFVCAVEGCHRGYYIKQQLKTHMIKIHKWNGEGALSFTWKDCRGMLKPARQHQQLKGLVSDAGVTHTNSNPNEQNIITLTEDFCTPSPAASDADCAIPSAAIALDVSQSEGGGKLKAEPVACRLDDEDLAMVDALGDGEHGQTIPGVKETEGTDTDPPTVVVAQTTVGSRSVWDGCNVIADHSMNSPGTCPCRDCGRNLESDAALKKHAVVGCEKVFTSDTDLQREASVENVEGEMEEVMYECSSTSESEPDL